jgi:hypothetical protein
MSDIACQSRESMIRRMQTNLNVERQQAGLPPIGVDGQWGPQTAGALRLALIARGEPCNMTADDATASFNEFYNRHTAICQRFGRDPDTFTPIAPNYARAQSCVAGTAPTPPAIPPHLLPPSLLPAPPTHRPWDEHPVGVSPRPGGGGFNVPGGVHIQGRPGGQGTTTISPSQTPGGHWGGGPWGGTGRW